MASNVESIDMGDLKYPKFRKYVRSFEFIRRERLLKVRNAKLAKDSKSLEDLEKRPDESKKSAIMITTKLHEAISLRARKESEQTTPLDDDIAQNHVEEERLFEELNKQSRTITNILDEKNLLRKRLDEEKENAAKLDEGLRIYLQAAIDDKTCQQLFNCQFFQALWGVSRQDDDKHSKKFTDLWYDLKRQRRIGIGNYEIIVFFLLSGDYDLSSPLITEVGRIQDKILEPYDTRDEFILSDFIKRGRVGKGGFGTVYRYQRIGNDETIAVKEIEFPQTDAAKEDSALMVEVKIMRELSKYRHSNIIRYLFEDFKHDKLYIGMEYMTGGSLREKIGGHPLQKEKLINYTYEILLGVSFLHDKHVTHRDVKSDNVLLDSNDRIKLADFGISKQLNTSCLAHGATTAGIGTWHYMSPEAVKGYDGDDPEKKGYGIKTDIWSIGCVVLEMTTGKRPWSEKSNRQAVMFSIGSGNHPLVADNISDDVKDFIQQSFIVNPKDRPSARELCKHKLFAGISHPGNEDANLAAAMWMLFTNTSEMRSLADYHRKNKRILGKGGFATVCLYQHNRTEEEIAVKEIDFPQTETKQYNALMAEVKIMRQLSQYNHPNIVQYYFESSDKATDKFYIGMEILTQGSLEKKINGHPLSQDEIRSYLHPILSGVKFLHEKRVVHRDIKPANILIGLDCVKLADFGISKQLNTNLLAYGATTAEQGTYQYMSPEAAKGFDDDSAIEGYGIKTDIWSTGCVLLAMATGKCPWYQYKSGASILGQLANGKPPPVTEIMPNDVNEFLAMTFIVNPADRPSAQALLSCKLLSDELYSTCVQLSDDNSGHGISTIYSNSVSDDNSGPDISTIYSNSLDLK